MLIHRHILYQLKLLCTGLLLLWSIMPVTAGIQQKATNFYKEQYKAGPQNWDLCQDSNGVMYIANMNGLLKYDGLQWQLTRPEGVGNSVRSLCVDKQGYIYVGAFNQFGRFKLTEKGPEQYECLSNAQSELNFGEIWHICNFDSSVVFQSNKHLFIYQNKQVSVLKAPSNLKYATVINNALYVSSDTEGIFLLINGVFTPLPNCKQLIGKSICAILPYLNDQLLIVTESEGIYTYGRSTLSPLSLPLNAELHRFQAYTAKRSGPLIAIGTVQNGVYIYNIHQQSYYIVNADNGLQTNTILGLCFDNENNLWLGENNGIDYLQINAAQRSLFARHNGYGSGYAAYLQAGILYLGTNQGLFCTTYKNGQIGAITSVEGTTGQVYGLQEIDGRLLCCHHKGLFEIKGDKSYKIAGFSGAWKVEKSLMLPNTLLVGCYTGIAQIKIENGTLQFTKRIDDFREPARQFEQDNEGNIWISHGFKGLYKVCVEQGKTHINFYGKDKGFASNEGISVYKVNNQVVFCSPSGIYAYNAATDSIVAHPMLRKSLPQDGVYHYLHEDAEKKLWYLKDEQIGWAVPQKNGYYSINQRLNFRSESDLIYEYFQLLLLDSDHLLICNDAGFSLINMPLLEKNSSKELRLRYIISQAGDTLYAGTTTATAELKTPNRHSTLSFCYSGMQQSTNNKSTHYIAQLLNDGSVTEVKTIEQKVDFENLKPGKYLFRIKTDQVGAPVYEYNFVLKAPWHTSPIAFVCYALLLISIAYLVVLLIRKKQSQKNNININVLSHNDLIGEKQLATNLLSKTNELTSANLNLTRKNEALSNIKNEIGKLLSNLPHDEKYSHIQSTLYNVLNLINNNLTHDNDWERFEQSFDELNQDFIKRLSEAYPSLTLSDKKLCIYLRMNMVSKDIAPLLNISVRGVEISRYRLRKKLNLNRDTNLTEFLQEY